MAIALTSGQDSGSYLRPHLKKLGPLIIRLPRLSIVPFRIQGEQPHIVVLTDHPLSRLLLYHYLPSTDVSSSPETTTGTLELSSSHWISSLSQPAEFLTGLVADHEAGICVASLYSGILNVVEIGVEDDDDDDGEGEESGRSKRNRAGKGKGNGKGKRKEIVDEDIEMKMDVDQGRATGKAKWGPMVFKEKYEIK